MVYLAALVWGQSQASQCLVQPIHVHIGHTSNKFGLNGVTGRFGIGSKSVGDSHSNSLPKQIM